MCSPPYSCNPNIFTTHLNLGIIPPIWIRVERTAGDAGLALLAGEADDCFLISKISIWNSKLKILKTCSRYQAGVESTLLIGDTYLARTA
jgi:hypothetical protein